MLYYVTYIMDREGVVTDGAVTSTVNNGLAFTTDYNQLSNADGVSIYIPTPLRKTDNPTFRMFSIPPKTLGRPSTMAIRSCPKAPSTSASSSMPSQTSSRRTEPLLETNSANDINAKVVSPPVQDDVSPLSCETRGQG